MNIPPVRDAPCGLRANTTSSPSISRTHLLSACVVLYHCGEEVTEALRCVEQSNIEVAVYLSDNSPEEMTADHLQWTFPGVTILPQQGNIGFGRANNAVLPYLQSKYASTFQKRESLPKEKASTAIYPFLWNTVTI